MQSNLYNLNIERKILNTILKTHIICENMELITKTDFYLPAHQYIFDTILLLQSKNKPLDEDFLRPPYIESKYLDDQVLYEVLESEIIQETDKNKYILELKDKGFKRALLKLTTTIKKAN